MKCNEIQELLEAYALGVLDEPEHEVVERHLEGCPQCSRLLNVYLETANSLPQALASASSLEVPPSLKQRVLQLLEKTTPSRQPSLPYNGRFSSTRVKDVMRRWIAWPRPPAFIALSAVLLSLISLVLNAHLTVALAKERSLRAEFASLVEQQELVLEVIDSNKTNKAFLRAVDNESNSYGKLYTRTDLPHVVVMAARLPQPESGQAYHFWVTEQGQPSLAGVLKINDQGFGMLVFEAGQDGPLYQSAELTLQPRGSTTLSGISVLRWQAPP